MNCIEYDLILRIVELKHYEEVSLIELKSD